MVSTSILLIESKYLASMSSLLYHGFSFMDKKLLLTAMHLMQCRLVPYIVNTVLCRQHFPRLVSAVSGGSVEHGCTYLDLDWIQLFRIIPNFLKLLKKHINLNHYWKSEFSRLPSDLILAINCINVSN